MKSTTNYFNNDSYIEESFEELSKRYIGFGKGLHNFFKIEYPHYFDKMTFYRYFYRNIGRKEPDSFIFYDNGEIYFAMQFDPECDVIIIWNDDHHFEYGTWEEISFKKIVANIEKHIMGKK